MTEVSAKSSQTRIRQATAPELSVVVACHTFACALATRFVVRLGLGEDIVDAAELGAGLVRSGNEIYASDNLGVLLGLAPLQGAWALLRVRGVPIALRTGDCLFVREVNVEAPLTPGLFSARGEAMLGAFVAARRDKADEPTFGLVLNLAQLWSQSELDDAAQRVKLARSRARHE